MYATAWLNNARLPNDASAYVGSAMGAVGVAVAVPLAEPGDVEVAVTFCRAASEGTDTVELMVVEEEEEVVVVVEEVAWAAGVSWVVVVCWVVVVGGGVYWVVEVVVCSVNSDPDADSSQRRLTGLAVVGELPEFDPSLYHQVIWNSPRLSLCYVSCGARMRPGTGSSRQSSQTSRGTCQDRHSRKSGTRLGSSRRPSGRCIGS